MPGRDEFATCPRCKAALDRAGARLVCKQCEGALVAEPEVSQLIADIVGNVVSTMGWAGRIAEPQPLVLAPREGGAGLVCPCCTAAMTAHKLYGIAVDRCEEHGVWFDKAELEAALQAAVRANRPLSTIGEKVFGGVFITAYIAANLLAFLFGG
jgi:Zn-finger nucleic acid-binding protein